MRSIGTAALWVTLLLGSLWPSASLPQTTATRTSSFIYDANTGLLTQKILEPDTPALKLQTDYVLDSFGHRTQVTASGTDAAVPARSSTMAYDAQGQFMSSATNALGQSDTWQYDARSGKPTSHTGPNHLTTTWSYDGFGRKTLQVREDGTQTKWSYAFCSGANGGTAACPAGAFSSVRATPLASDGTTQNGPLLTTYLDALGREVARDTQGFDGSLIRLATQYDALGNVLKKSRPYFVSGGTPQWMTYAYDQLNRMVTETMPNGSKTQHAYSGLRATHTNGLNQTRTEIMDIRRQIVSVTDALGSVTSFTYDPFGNLLQTTDPAGNVITASFDLRGRRTGNSDPDLGAMTNTYDAFGEVTSQTDAKGQVTQLTYDKLGRVTQRVEADMTSNWTYDTAANGIGKLASAGTDSGYQRAVIYDSLGRPTRVDSTIDGQIYTFTAAYDANRRLSTVTYPSGFTVRKDYTALGYATDLADTASGNTLWTAVALDAELRLTYEVLGNGNSALRTFDQQTGRLTALFNFSRTLQDSAYEYDAVGNLTKRTDNVNGFAETFTYDALNRLTQSSTNLSPQPLLKTLTYDLVGNMLTKSDVGTYTYPAAGAVQPHAVTSISGAAINTTFTYDANGNQTAGLGRTITYTSFNKQASITQGSKTLTFSHDFDHQRYKQVSPEGTTLYLDAFGVHAELTVETGQWNEYLSADGSGMVGMRVLHADQTASFSYFHKDHLGSIAIITGPTPELLSYDAWGKRRLPTGQDDTTGSVTSAISRGFTGEEMLADAGLVHLNGRVYDPRLGRMLSVDPIIHDRRDGQSYNPYSYVHNNPLARTDRSGLDDDDSGTPADFFIPSQPVDLGGGSNPGSNPSGGGGIAGINNVPINPLVLSSDLAQFSFSQPDFGNSFSFQNAPTAFTFGPQPEPGFFGRTWNAIGDFYNTPISANAYPIADLSNCDMCRANPLLVTNVDLLDTITTRQYKVGDVLAPALDLAALVPFLGPEAKLAAVGEGLAARELSAAAGADMAAVRALGQAGEDAVRGAYEIGPATRITLDNGATRIPDGLLQNVLSEVKNVESLSYTQQLRDFANFAQQNGSRFDLYVRPGATLSGPLLDARAAGRVNILEIPFP